MKGIRENVGVDGKVTYLVRVRAGGHSATRTFDTEREAKDWYQETRADIRRRKFIAPSKESERTTLKAALERYGEEVTAQKKDSTQKREINRIAVLAALPLASRLLPTIKSSDIATFIRERQAIGHAANTIRLDLALLSHVFVVARCDWGMETLANPTEHVRKPKTPEGRLRRLENDEEIRLLERAWEPLVPVIKWAIETAMRRSEIVGLRWEQIDTQDCVARLTDTKNGTSRDVPLSHKALKVLEGLPRSEDGSVFGLSLDSITGAMRRACVGAGIKGLTFHDLRHEAISRLFEHTDLDIMEIARISGHKTVAMLSRYTHLRAENLAARLNGAKRG